MIISPIDFVNCYVYTQDYTKLDLDLMYQGVRENLLHCVDTYKEVLDVPGVGNILDMDMEQQILINGKRVGSGDLDDDEISASYVVCPKNMKLTIVHCYDSAYMIPIPNTSFKIVAKTWKYFDDDSITPIEGRVDEEGKAEVVLPNEFIGKHIEIIFYPEVTQADIKAMYDSYDSTIQAAVSWLDGVWEREKPKWKSFKKDGLDITESTIEFAECLWNEIVKAWDEIKKLGMFMLDPMRYISKLAKYFSNPEQIEKLLDTMKDKAHKIFTILQDEVRVFIFFMGTICRLVLLTPKQIQHIMDIGVAMVLVNAVIIYLTRGTSLKAKILTMTLDASGYASMIVGDNKNEGEQQ